MTIDRPLRPTHAGDTAHTQTQTLAHRLQARLTTALSYPRLDAASAPEQRRRSAAALIAQLRGWRRVLRLGGAVALAGGLAISPIGAGLASAATATPARFVERSGPINPFDGVTLSSASGGVSFADIDADGDLDAFIGAKNHTVYYYENTGSATAPVFTERTGVDNPFNAFATQPGDAPNFADLDGDGDLDAVLSGISCGMPCGQSEPYAYYENVGTALTPSFTVRTGGANPFTVMPAAINESPELIDIDGDGDFDAFTLVNTSGTFSVAYFENTGTPASPTFTERTGADNPFPSGTDPVAATPTFTDIDGDGDADAFVATGNGTIAFYENTGSATAPAFTLVGGPHNPFDGVNQPLNHSPAFAELDGDGDADGFVLANSGTPVVVFYENTSDAGVAAGPNAAEQDAAPGTFVITRTNPRITGPLTFSYTLGGTATAGADYALVPDANATVDGTTITLADGADSATIQVVPVDDGAIEGPESVQLAISLPDGYFVKPTTAQITIVDNDRLSRTFLPLVIK